MQSGFVIVQPMPSCTGAFAEAPPNTVSASVGLMSAQMAPRLNVKVQAVVLAVHALSAGDALQLAAAIDYVGDRPHHQSFVTADGRLAEAATRTGFDVTVPR